MSHVFKYMMANELEIKFIDIYAECMLSQLKILEPTPKLQLEYLHFYWKLLHQLCPKIDVVQNFMLCYIEKDRQCQTFDMCMALNNITDCNHDWHLILMSKVIRKIQHDAMM